MFKIKSKDNKIITVDKDIARKCNMIKIMAENDDDEKEFELNIEEKYLLKIFEYASLNINFDCKKIPRPLQLKSLKEIYGPDNKKILKFLASVYDKNDNLDFFTNLIFYVIYVDYKELSTILNLRFLYEIKTIIKFSDDKVEDLRNLFGKSNLHKEDEYSQEEYDKVNQKNQLLL